MADPDLALQELKRINKEFAVFIGDKGAASEADTRVKLVDRILTSVPKMIPATVGWVAVDELGGSAMQGECNETSD
jgi:hypothetical protein